MEKRFSMDATNMAHKVKSKVATELLCIGHQGLMSSFLEHKAKTFRARPPPDKFEQPLVLRVGRKSQGFESRFCRE